MSGSHLDNVSSRLTFFSSTTDFRCAFAMVARTIVMTASALAGSAGGFSGDTLAVSSVATHSSAPTDRSNGMAEFRSPSVRATLFGANLLTCGHIPPPRRVPCLRSASCEFG
jgi:hypothetical protein